MKRYSAAIFDLDGTLLNTLGDLCGAVNTALAAQGLPPITEEQTRERVGNGIRNLILRSLPEGAGDAAADQCLAVFRAHYEQRLHERTRPYEGIPALLRALREQGIKVAVLSNKYDPASKRLIAHFFPGLVSLTLGERPGVPRKPDPTAVLEALEALGEQASDTLYIGDSGVDMQTAKNAGLDSAGVTWGFRSREVLVKNGAGVLIDHPSQLLRYFVQPETLADAFTGRGFGFSYFQTAKEAVDYLKGVCRGKQAGFGGSMTLEGLGLYDALREGGEVQWHWRGDAPSTAPEVFLTSANALALTGEVVNIDGNCNRAAASMYGSEAVYFVCGVNKLAPNLTSAVSRARNIAAPRNAQRLGKHTPCAADGKCHDCRSPERICRALAVLLAPSNGVKHPEIVLVGEELGY